jgi:uncharacterized protein (DUF433 family)
MARKYAEWQLAELLKLGGRDRDRAERALNAVWSAMPGLYEELAASAGLSFDFEDSPKACPTYALVETVESSVARLTESRIAVWEIVREHRRSGSMDELTVAFSSLDRGELEAAIDYGQQHREEIDLLIERYESMIEHRRAQYPNTR